MWLAIEKFLATKDHHVGSLKERFQIVGYT